MRWKSLELAPPLVCFGWAGAGASAFREWQLQLGNDFAVYAARLPGRESRIGEPPVRDARALAAQSAEGITSLLDRPPRLFGHCSGALIAYEVALELQRACSLKAEHLLVASQPAPHIARPRHPTGDLREEMIAHGFRDRRVLADPELFELVAPAIRADMEMVTNYQSSTEILHTPITALRGTLDATVETDSVGAWAEVTSSDFELLEIEGDHLFSGSFLHSLLRAVRGQLHDPSH